MIDLTRLPSHGRDVALVLRQRKATRRVPLVFVEGERDKVARLREVLPDAFYTTWSQVGETIKKAILEPPPTLVVPASALAGYSGTPLPKKLGIKPHSVVGLWNPPENVKEVLGELPEGVQLKRETAGAGDLRIWFLNSRRQLEANVAGMAREAADRPMWIAWPKKGSTLASDLSQQLVREVAMAAGLVDYKVCAIDACWSGLLFRRRKV